jgi:alpha-galactosidase
MAQNSLFSQATSVDTEIIFEGAQEPWKSAEKVTIDRYWDAQPAIRTRAEWNTLTRISALWNQTHLFFKFECNYDTLYIKPELGPDGPIDELWEWDVVEVFLRPPDSSDYFEFEVSPLGQWLDVHVIKPRQDVDFAWMSHLEVTVQLDELEKAWAGVLKIPFEPMLRTVGTERPPEPGDVWGINLFRLAGEPTDREYLAWRPTRTLQPDFHVPSAFGHLILLEEA